MRRDDAARSAVPARESGRPLPVPRRLGVVNYRAAAASASCTREPAMMPCIP